MYILTRSTTTTIDTVGSTVGKFLDQWSGTYTTKQLSMILHLDLLQANSCVIVEEDKFCYQSL